MRRPTGPPTARRIRRRSRSFRVASNRVCSLRAFVSRTINPGIKIRNRDQLLRLAAPVEPCVDCIGSPAPSLERLRGALIESPPDAAMDRRSVRVAAVHERQEPAAEEAVAPRVPLALLRPLPGHHRRPPFLEMGDLPVGFSHESPVRGPRRARLTKLVFCTTATRRLRRFGIAVRGYAPDTPPGARPPSPARWEGGRAPGKGDSALRCRDESGIEDGHVVWLPRGRSRPGELAPGPGRAGRVARGAREHRPHRPRTGLRAGAVRALRDRGVLGRAPAWDTWGEDRNHHAHLMLPARVLNATGDGFAKQLRGLDEPSPVPEEISALRGRWQDRANAALMQGRGRSPRSTRGGRKDTCASRRWAQSTRASSARHGSVARGTHRAGCPCRSTPPVRPG